MKILSLAVSATEQVEEDDWEPTLWTSPNGTQEWSIQYDGSRLPHRVDGPAILYSDGSYTWYYHGKTHRENGGPAMTWKDGSCNWSIHGDTVMTFDSYDSGSMAIKNPSLITEAMINWVKDNGLYPLYRAALK